MIEKIYYNTLHEQCNCCHKDLPNGTLCYRYNDDIYCTSCWNEYLMELTRDCEWYAEDVEVLL